MNTEKQSNIYVYLSTNSFKYPDSYTTTIHSNHESLIYEALQRLISKHAALHK